MNNVISRLELYSSTKRTLHPGDIVRMDPTPDAAGVFSLSDGGTHIVIYTGATFKGKDRHHVAIVYSGRAVANNFDTTKHTFARFVAPHGSGQDIINVVYTDSTSE